MFAHNWPGKVDVNRAYVLKVTYQGGILMSTVVLFLMHTADSSANVFVCALGK